MTIPAILLLAAMSAILMALLWFVARYDPEAARREFLSKNGFEAFMREFPNAVRYGRVTCPKCSSSRLWVRRGREYDAHCCQTCGRVHYLS
jgi:hypothetical protein